MLQIPLAELQEHGVVSAHTAERMAAQARLLTGADYGVSLTGVAGPDSLEGHPAGTVFIGIAGPKEPDRSRSISLVGVVWMFVKSQSFMPSIWYARLYY